MSQRPPDEQELNLSEFPSLERASSQEPDRELSDDEPDRQETPDRPERQQPDPKKPERETPHQFAMRLFALKTKQIEMRKAHEQFRGKPSGPEQKH